MAPRSLQGLALPLLLAAAACASGPGAEPAAVGTPAVEPRNGAAASIAPETVLDGVYTTAQAARGASQYSEGCSACHAADLRGNSNAPSLLGLSFLFVWETRSLEEFFTTIRTRMPTNAPNSLPVTSYLDIVAYVLEANGFPAGPSELRADPAVLGRITITGS
jgi:mono/diheme cytochrome c family protein